jgi:hypothetical protein
MPTRVSLIICVPLVLALVGCSAAGEAKHPSPSVSETTEEQGTLPECEGFLFDEGGQLSGDLMAGCISATMMAHNFGKMTVDSDEHGGLTSFRYQPEFAASVELSGETRLLIEGDQMWFKDEMGWVQAVKDDSDVRANMAHAVASTFRAMSDPRAAVDMISTPPVWDIIGDEEVETVDGNTVTAWKFTAAESFTYLGVQFSELSFWLDRDYTTVQQHAESSAMGVSATTLNRYYDWGVEEEFTVPPVE